MILLGTWSLFESEHNLKDTTWFLNQDMPEIKHCSKIFICKNIQFGQHDDYKAHLWNILLLSWFKSQKLVITIENIIF